MSWLILIVYPASYFYFLTVSYLLEVGPVCTNKNLISLLSSNAIFLRLNRLLDSVLVPVKHYMFVCNFFV
jgi:hypothetical protein